MRSRVLHLCLFILMATVDASAQENQVATKLKPASTPIAAVDNDGFTPLFNGKNLSGWRNPFEWGEAKVVDGEIHLKAEKQYSDYQLTRQD